MRAQELTPVTEVAMNPSSFADSLAQADTKGVLVGFEFEVLIPSSSFPEVVKKVELNVKILKKASELYSDSIPEFISIINTKPKARVQLQDALQVYEKNVVDKVKKLYLRLGDALREELKTHSLPLVKKRTSAAGMFSEQYWYGDALVSEYYGNHGKYYQLGGVSERDREIMMDISNAYKNGIRNILMIATGKSRFIEMIPFLSFDEEKLRMFINQHDLEDTDDDPEDMSRISELLTPALQKMTGRNVITFKEYHEKKKNATDWYIEPDGSLEPDDDDASAEIVTPPLPVREAVDALKNFYQLARQLNLYTNPSTGLHMNVSIPEKLDVAKLAVFLGDQYVLKSFGRENNEYAISVLRDLKSRVSDDPDEFVDVKTRAIPKSRGGGEEKISQLNMKLLSQVAKNISNEHVASISFNGKYVSFRHAGGDYLNKQQAINDLLGRFVRAMVIASDPNAYRQEYIKKLSALVSKDTTPEYNDGKSGMLSTVNALRNKGLPVITLHAFSKVSPNNELVKSLLYAQELADKYNLQVGNVEPTDDATKQSFGEQIISYYGEDALESYAYSFQVEVIPITGGGLKMVTDKVKSRDGFRVGLAWNGGGRTYHIASVKVLPPSDPRVMAMIKSIYKNYQNTRWD